MRRAALGIGAAVAVVVPIALVVDKRDDRVASPIAVLTHTQRALNWDALVARKWPEIDTPARIAARTGREMEAGFGGSDVLAAFSTGLAGLARSELQILLTREARLRKHQGATGRLRARALGKGSWWLTTWCDAPWQENQAALLGSAFALLDYFGYEFSPDRPSDERALRALIQCRRAIRFSITADDASASRERERTNWFIPVAEKNAELLVRVRALKPGNAQQRQWHRGLLDASEADASWLRFIVKAQQGKATDAERRREVGLWVPLDSAFTRATANALRPDW